MPVYEDICAILDAAATLDDAVDEVMDSDEMSEFAIRIGLQKMRSARRRSQRQELKYKLAPTFNYSAAGTAVFTPASAARMLQYTADFYAANGWNVGGVNIGDFTKKNLLELATKERKSANGHITNAEIYEALAEPMEDDDIQTVREYWEEPPGPGGGATAGAGIGPTPYGG